MRGGSSAEQWRVSPGVLAVAAFAIFAALARSQSLYDLFETAQFHSAFFDENNKEITFNPFQDGLNWEAKARSELKCTPLHRTSRATRSPETGSTSDVFTPTGRTKIVVIWDLAAKKTDDKTCEFTNTVQTCATPELLDFLGKQGMPLDVFRGARKPISEAHKRQETPMFAKGIERHALQRGRD